MTVLRAGAATDVGRVRSMNQDQLLVAPNLFAVADGMGGHAAGEVAAATALEALQEAVAASGAPVPDALVQAAQAANRAIWEQAGANPEYRGMGTTLVAMAMVPDGDTSRLAIVNVGDSRVYRLAGDQFGQLTVDHSEVQELVLSGAITPEQARIHPRRNIVTRALGSDFVVRPDHWLLPPLAGDRYLVCSDGLTGELTDEEILPLLSAGNQQEAAAALVAAADEAGGHDNTTVIVVDVIG